MTHSPATEWSVAFMGHLISRGVTDFVVSPGARSQALALAALAWERVEGSGVSVHVVVDERSAAFRALGLGLESGRPAVCISTSGSAPAHYYPAILEALHSGVPLIALSADRPIELHGVGANQTTRQEGLFGDQVPSWSIPAPEATDSDEPGTGATEIAEGAVTAAYGGTPVHVNVSFREPLSGSIDQATLALPATVEPPDMATDTVAMELEPEPGTVVVAGHGAGPRAAALAVELGAPLIAEVVSGSRFGPHLVHSYREVLANKDLVASIGRVITLGRPTLSRQVSALLATTDYQHIVVRGAEYESANPSRQATMVDRLSVKRPATKEEAAQWVKPWVMAGRGHYESALADIEPHAPNIAALTSDDPATRSAFATEEMTVLRREITRKALALALWEATWPHDRLVLGASRMVREADQIVPGKNIPVVSNRGLSGIDGTIATARGVAWAAARSGAVGTTRVLLGDLAFVHDVGSLMREPERDDPTRVHIIVANDGGGSIFDQLEVSDTASAEDRDRVLFTPQSVDFGALASAYGWAYRRVTSMGDLSDALSAHEPHLIIDVTLPRS
jgi:2-succinyl-5-enolpyruvyl-6-hydroxy-3-cyclohexene-1-carboxylate synthase